jgi:hypothetical protein
MRRATSIGRPAGCPRAYKKEPTVAHAQRKQISCRDIVSDPATQFSGKLGVLGDNKIVRRLEGVELATWVWRCSFEGFG